MLLEQRREVRLLRVLHTDRTAHHALIPQHVVLEPLVRGDDVQRQRARVRRRRHHGSHVADVVLAQQTGVELAVVHVAVYLRQLDAQLSLTAGHLLERLPRRQTELSAELVESAHSAGASALHRGDLLGV